MFLVSHTEKKNLLLSGDGIFFLSHNFYFFGAKNTMF